MKQKILTWLGKKLISIDAPRICIVDDEDIYFNKEMINVVKNTGLKNIERHKKIDIYLLNRMQKKPFDIVILDIRGIIDPSIAKDGMQIASLLSRTTNSYIVIVSAHQFHLVNEMTKVDYIIENKLMTAVDFLDEVFEILSDYLSKKTSSYKKIILKAGLSALKRATLYS